MFKSDQINELATALAKAQAKLKSAKKDSQSHGYKYSDLATVIEEAQRVLPEFGLSYSQLPGVSGEGVASVTTILMHSSGQFIGSEASIKIPQMRGINETQMHGAALSYLRRYSLQAVLGMASEDNDAASDQVEKSASFSKQVSFKAANIPVKTEEEVKSAQSVKNAEVAEKKKQVSFKNLQIDL